MGKMKLELRMGDRSQKLVTHASNLIIGKAKDCGLCVPIAWLCERHLEIDQQAGMLRVRTLSDGACVYFDEQSVGRQWFVVPHDATLEVRGPDNQNISLHIVAKVDAESLVLTHDTRSGSIEDYAGAIVATAEGEMAEEPSHPAPTRPEINARAPRDAEETPRKLRRILIALGMIVGLCALGALVYNQYVRISAGNRASQDITIYMDEVDKARAKLDAGDFTAAKTSLMSAEAMVRQHAGWNDQAIEVRQLLNRPEIQYGANGYVTMGGKWVLPEVATAWQAAKLRNNSRIESRLADAKKMLGQRQLADARTVCAEALAMMEDFPAEAKPHFSREMGQDLQKQIENELVAKEMLAKGMVLYKKRWLTPDDKFRTQQQEKGLVEYKSKWMGKADAYAAEQTDKGLVLYGGKWMTPEQKLIAQGYVQFEGKWVMAGVRDNILAQRVAAEQAQKAEAIRLAAVRKEDDRLVESRKEEAYAMSQVFIKKTLKHPESATFSDYSDSRVIVVYKDGWYIVRATLKGENGLGVILGRVYIVKLRPTTGTFWESELADLLDE